MPGMRVPNESFPDSCFSGCVPTLLVGSLSDLRGPWPLWLQSSVRASQAGRAKTTQGPLHPGLILALMAEFVCLLLLLLENKTRSSLYAGMKDLQYI